MLNLCANNGSFMNHSWHMCLYTNDLIWEQGALSSVNQDVASLIQCNYWRLGVHCLRLPGFNVYTSRDLRPPPPVFCLELNVMIII